MKSTADQHQDWLSQVETDGPFLALPVLKDIWPHGVDRLGDADDRAVTFKQAFSTWERLYDSQSGGITTEYREVTRAWIETVLDDLAGWHSHRLTADDPLLDVEIRSPGEHVAVRPHGAIRSRAQGGVAALLRVVQPTESLSEPGLDGWAANELDRMAALLRKADVAIGLVTDGRWWALVWAGEGKPTGSGVVDALLWREEPLLRDAFLTLIDQRRFRDKNPELRLSRLFERSELEAEEITEALGVQVRKSVELLVQAFSEARLAAAKRGDVDPLTDKPDDVYQAAVTVMMRVVFLLFAEERAMLPTEELYWDSYAVRDLLDGLQDRAQHEGEENLDESHDVWHRLLAVSKALFAGVNYDEMRMPAYGGSLLDPARFPWLTATDERGLRLEVSDRVMLHVLESVQVANVKGEARRISFRDVDVEQIGYIYEGLLGYTCRPVEGDVIIGLVGKVGEEPEIDAAALEGLDHAAADGRSFASALIDWVKEHQPGAKTKTAAQLVKLYDAEVDEAEMHRLLTPVASGDKQLLEFLVYWGKLIRRDLRGIPYVVPVGGLVVVETPSRRNAGAHYTPRALAEEVVLHALQPLVYDPGPLQTDNEEEWRLKSSTAILDLKVADIAAGSGAFLVAAARFLADRVTEAWFDEGLVGREERVQPKLATDRAVREVVARCLYGADINPMAVEMSKLSLWLVSLDPTKPFSFVDDRIFCGNSLLGLTSLDQLRHMHIAPDTKRKYLQSYVDVDAVLAQAIGLRKALATTVNEYDPQRSIEGKSRLLEQSARVTAKLRLIADGVIAAGLSNGGKPDGRTGDAYKALEWALAEAFPVNQTVANRSKLDAILSAGLTPSVTTDYERWAPLHWVIEAPEVFLERSGFDAVIGNPPFLGGKKISPANGLEYRAWLRWVVADGSAGNSDLAGYFVLRAHHLSRRACRSLGLITTDTLAQGDTREVALDRLFKDGMAIRRCIQSRAWSSRFASVRYAVIWAVPANCMAKGVEAVWNEQVVGAISTFLEPEGRVRGTAHHLAQNQNLAFVGSNVNGEGFTVTADQAATMIAHDERNKLVLLPYLGGEELNGSPESAARRWIVNFGDMPEVEARRFGRPFAWVDSHVKVYRKSLTNKPRLQELWWQYERRAIGLYRAVAGQEYVLAIAITSKTLMPVIVPAKQVFSHSAVVFALNSLSNLATLSSSPHQLWAVKYGSGMKADPRYTPTDVFETFPRPGDTGRLEGAGKVLNEERGEIMRRRNLGMTAIYNLVNDPDVRVDRDVERVRQIHIEVDEAVAAAYGWDDLVLEHGFHTYRQMERFTVSPTVRVELIDRLLEENHKRARLEGQELPEQSEGLF